MNENLKNVPRGALRAHRPSLRKEKRSQRILIRSDPSFVCIREWGSQAGLIIRVYGVRQAGTFLGGGYETSVGSWRTSRIPLQNPRGEIN